MTDDVIAIATHSGRETPPPHGGGREERKKEKKEKKSELSWAELGSQLPISDL